MASIATWNNGVDPYPSWNTATNWVGSVLPVSGADNEVVFKNPAGKTITWGVTVMFSGAGNPNSEIIFGKVSVTKTQSVPLAFIPQSSTTAPVSRLRMQTTVGNPQVYVQTGTALVANVTGTQGFEVSGGGSVFSPASWGTAGSTLTGQIKVLDGSTYRGRFIDGLLPEISLASAAKLHLSNGPLDAASETGGGSEPNAGLFSAGTYISPKVVGAGTVVLSGNNTTSPYVPSRLPLYPKWTSAFNGTLRVRHGCAHVAFNSGIVPADFSFGGMSKIEMCEYEEATPVTSRWTRINLFVSGTTPLPQIVSIPLKGTALNGSSAIHRIGGDKTTDFVVPTGSWNAYAGNFALQQASLRLTPSTAAFAKYTGAKIANAGAEFPIISLSACADIWLEGAGTYDLRRKIYSSTTSVVGELGPAQPSTAPGNAIVATDDATLLASFDGTKLLQFQISAGKTLTLEPPANLSTTMLMGSSSHVSEGTLVINGTTYSNMSITGGGTARMGANGSCGLGVAVVKGAFEFTKSGHLGGSTTVLSLEPDAIGKTAIARFIGATALSVARPLRIAKSGVGRSTLEATGTAPLTFRPTAVYCVGGTTPPMGELALGGNGDAAVVNRLDWMRDRAAPTGTNPAGTMPASVTKYGSGAWAMTDVAGVPSHSGGTKAREGTLWLISERAAGCVTGTGTTRLSRTGDLPDPVLRTAKGTTQKGRHTYKGDLVLDHNGRLRIGG